MRKRVRAILLIPLLICVFTSCRTIEKENLKLLKSKEFVNYTLFYNETVPEKQIQNYDKITDNMYLYLTTKMGLDFEKPHFNLAVLPIENDVVDFRKRNTNACTDYENIYLIDMFNLPEEIYQEYGEPPEGIADDAFSHELAHLMTHSVIKYKKSNKLRPEELNSVSFSYIDFTVTEFRLLNDITDIVNNNIGERQLEQLKEEGLISLRNATGDRTLAVFLLYLHTREEYGRILTFLEANSLKDFIEKANWNKDDDRLFIQWLNEYMDK